MKGEKTTEKEGEKNLLKKKERQTQPTGKDGERKKAPIEKEGEEKKPY